MLAIDKLSQLKLPILITLVWVALHYYFPKSVTILCSVVPTVCEQTFMMYVHIQQHHSISQVYLGQLLLIDCEHQFNLHETCFPFIQISYT